MSMSPENYAQIETEFEKTVNEVEDGSVPEKGRISIGSIRHNYSRCIIQKNMLRLFMLCIPCLILVACGTTPQNIPDISGKYLLNNIYSVELSKDETSTDSDIYDFSVLFNISENDVISGSVAIGEEFVFDGSNSIDNGTLTFSYKNAGVYLTLDSARHGKFNEELMIQEIPDYSNLNLEVYCKKYYSPSELYGISLLQDASINGFYVDLNYASGFHDEGSVIPGEETTLAGGTSITLLPQENAGMHIILYSAISSEGNFDEDLIEGDLFDKIGITPVMLAQMDYAEAFSHLCEIEKGCIGMNATTVVEQPSVFCNGKIYRFSGEVLWCDGTHFLLQITDALENHLENNVISCYSSNERAWVSVGDIVCVYGYGIGEDTYTRTYSDGTIREFTTLAFDVGYTLYQEDRYYNFTDCLDMYPEIKDFIYGTYQLKDGGSAPYLLEDTITITEDGINGRPYEVDSIYIDFSGVSSTRSLESKVYIEFNVMSSSKHMDRQDPVLEYPLSFQIALDGKICYYSSRWFDQEAYIPIIETASYVKVD